MNERVLEWVNAQRDEFNIGPPLDKLPSGSILAAASCPIACGLSGPNVVNVAASGSRVDIMLRDRPAVAVRPTPEVRRFIRDFDNGECSELVA